MTHKIFRLVSSLFLALAVLGSSLNPQPVRAAGPWYVSTTGDDNNDCQSSTTACLTINGAINKAANGDTIYVAVGTYTGSDSSVVSLYNDLTLSGGWSSDFATQSGFSIIDGQNVRTGISPGTGVVDHFKIMNGYSYYGAGGIESYGSLILNNSIVINNRTDGGSTGSAGGIFSAGDLTLNNSTVQGNISRGRAGGILMYVNDTLTLNNSTITWNQAADSGGGIVFSGGSGGGDAPVANILNSTISNNTAQFGGGMKIEGWFPSRTVNISNSIIANNIGITEGPDCWGEINTLDHSIIGDTSNCTVPSGTGNLVNLNPLISTYPVGLVAYHTLLTGSPAIDGGNNATCLDVDQRGMTRPQGAACDIGAYEYTTPGAAASLLVAGGNSQLTGTTFAFPKPLQTAVLDSQGSPVSGVTVEFAAPGSGASGTFADTGTNTTLVNTDGGGVATTPVFTANGQAGTYVVSASATGLGSVNFNLEQVVRPVNDNFADTEAIASLPFSTAADITDATTEPDEQQICYSMDRTVWYSFTPTETMRVRADTQGGAINGNVNIYHASGSGISDLQFLSCTGPDGSPTFIAEANQTYYLQAGSALGEVGNIQINLEQVPPPANDDFVSASPISSFPSTTDFTNLAATMESGEPTPSCAYTSPPFSTIWFSFTPARDEIILANLPNNSFNPFWAVYSGTSLSNLTELGCRNYGSLFWQASAGQTYYIQIGGLYGESGSGTLSLETALPPQANFSFSPGDPSKFDTIQFYDNSYDPTGIGIETWEWDFGDGAPRSTHSNPTHMYSADGDYDVTLTVTTFDGRTASITQTISLGSHDVTITKVESPGSGRVGSTQRITVTVSNIKASPETVTVDLYKSVPNGGFEYVASLTLRVPASTRGRVTKFVFQYTFTSADAQIGKMIFRAVANIDGIRDSFPQDNERLSLITTLRRPISYP